MSLVDYKGPSNSQEILPHLIGEKIKAAFPVRDGEHTRLWLVMESGSALVLCSIGGGTPCMWKEPADKVLREIQRRVDEIERQTRRLGKEKELLRPTQKD